MCTTSWGPGKHSMLPSWCRPLFLKPKCHKKSKNGFKPINFRSPLLVIFSNYLFWYQKLSKKFDVLLNFEILSQYMCKSKTSSEKFGFRTSRICWKITKNLKTKLFFHMLLFVFETSGIRENRTFCQFFIFLSIYVHK